jgi:hypothetical protein
MFNAKPSQQQATPTDDVIVPAPLGYSLLIFDPSPQTKPDINALLLLLRETLPVVGFVLRDGKADPISVVAAPEGALRFLFVGTKVYALDDSGAVWTNFDQFQQALLQTWKDQRQLKEPQPQVPRQLTITPGETAVIRRTGFFDVAFSARAIAQ